MARPPLSPISKKLLKFSSWGAIVFAWGIGLNLALVEGLRIDKQAAYAVVILSQVFLGFALNRRLVFDSRSGNAVRIFLAYLAALMVFRAADWALYALQINVLAMPYLAAQIINNILIFLSKFFTYRRIFEPAGRDADRRGAHGGSVSGPVETMNDPAAANRSYPAAQDRMQLLPNYYRWILRYARPCLRGTVIDLGCGRGLMIPHYLPLVERVVAVDYNPLLLDKLKRTIADPKLETVQMDLLGSWRALAGVQADAIVAMDILEHFEDDRLLLRRMAATARSAAGLFIKVPAMGGLFSEMDKASGHYRRYDRGDLLAKTAEVGLEPVFLRTINPLGALLYRFRNQRPTNFSKSFSVGQLRLANHALRMLPLLDNLRLGVGLSLVGLFRVR